MVRWSDVFRTVPLAALLAGSAAAQPAGGHPGGEAPPFPPPGFGHPRFEPRVEGLPFRAASVAEFVGNGGGEHLRARLTTGLVARDTAGRTRREDVMGPEEARVVAIDDPVASVRYILFPDQGKGRRLTDPRREGRPRPGDGRWLGPRADQGPPPEVKTESLGSQVVAGVEAEGTRDTITIPAGVHGNAAPVEVVSETWYSALLKTVVRQRHRGPRGERTWTLTEITRGEPEASLFEVPAGVEIEEGGFR